MLDLNFIPHPLIGTPYGTALDLCIILSIAAYLLSVVTREYSWVDRLWTLCPPIYCLIVAASLDFESVRVNLMTLLVFVWGARLTYNYARKGGFAKGGEDYRWAEIQKRHGPFWFQVLNLVFIAPGQMLIVWLFTAPVHIAWMNQDMALNWIDALAGLVFFAFLVGEAVSDEQMWRFQQEKKRKYRGWRAGGPRLHDHGLVRLLPASELYLRARYVVELLLVRHRRLGAACQLDLARLHCADDDFLRLVTARRVHLALQISVLRRLSGEHSAHHSLHRNR